MVDFTHPKKMQNVTSPSLLLLILTTMIMANVTSSQSMSGPHIADVNLLLPPKMTYPVEYRLQGSDGCFKWSWDHHDLLSVTPEYNVSNHCSTSAQVRSIAPYSGRKETAIYATDVHTGSVIRCKVYIDHFSRIQIFHNSIKLDLEGLATLRVRAFDGEDNVFSSLVGLQFMWHRRPENKGLLHYLAHVPLKESPLSDCSGLCGDLSIQQRLEDNGVYSDLYVVKGTEIGQEVVSVHLLEPKFERMGDKIVLTVAEAMSLDPPSPVLALIGAIVQYNLKVIRGNIPQAVMLPSLYHRWSIRNTSVAEADSATGVVKALTLGVTTVVVEDTRIDGHVQMSSLHVVIPGTLSLYILPVSPSGDPVGGMNTITSASHWYIICGHQYLIQVKVFSQGLTSQEIFITKNDDLKLHYDQSEYWKTSPVSNDIAVEHGWQNSRILTAISKGLGKLTASLTYFGKDAQRKEVLNVLQEVMVCEQVKFSLDKKTGVSGSPMILLPWAPGVYQEVELIATGGCAKTSSEYRWFSSDMVTISVSASGVVQAKQPGKATIRVISIFDPFNHDEVVIEVSIPSTMTMLGNFAVETVVGSHLKAAVTMKSLSGAYFYRCDAFSSFTTWKAESESFVIIDATGENSFLDKPENFMLNEPVSGPPCAWSYVYASGPGQTTLHATLAKEYTNYGHHPHAPISLKASSHIAAYTPLVVRQLGDGSQFGGYRFDLEWAESHNHLEILDSLYLAPATQLDIMLFGGPDPWGEGVNFVENVEIVTENHVALKDGALVKHVSSTYGGFYKVLCQTPGNFKLVFKRGNLAGEDHLLPVVAEAVLLLACSFPSSIVLLADKPVNDLNAILASTQADRDPGRIHHNLITVANGRIIRMAAVGISDTGNAFANSSSLSLSWELSSCEDLALWDDAYDRPRPKSSWESFLVLQNYSGMCTVRATVTGFIPVAERLENVLTDAIHLQVVSTLTVDPEYNLIFLHPDAKVNLSITGGSCFLEAMVNDSRVVEVFLPPSGLQCLQLTVVPKGLGAALVTVNDVGTAPPLVASSLVRVADVDWIKISSADEISLMEGSSQSFKIIAGAYDGSTFDSSQYVYMNIRVHNEEHMIEIINDGNLSSPGDCFCMSKFRIMARRLGITTLYVSATQHSGHEIFSQLITMEVYGPPRIHPDNIFLVPGASFMLTLKEGPRIGVSIEYYSLEDGIATVDKFSGRLSAISPGNMTILAKVYGNEDIVICQAHGKVEVGVPSWVALNTQSEQIDIGREMPIYPSLPKGDLFSFYEVCQNYKWNIEDEEVLSFHLVERLHGDKLGIITTSSTESYLDDEYSGFIRSLYGRSAGRTNVSVSFSCDFLSASYSVSRSYSASLSLLVVSDLPLSLGKSMTWILPPHYTTTSLLPSSSESHCQMDSQSQKKTTISYSVLRIHGGTNEAIEKDNVFIDMDKIRTTEENTIACIQAKDCTSGKVEIAACLRVDKVAQIRIKSKKVPVHVINLSIGSELDLLINYCDALGNPFHEACNAVSLAAQTNYPNLVSISSTSDGKGNINLKAIGCGSALVRLSIGNSLQKSDYVLVGDDLSDAIPIPAINLNISGEGLNDQVFYQTTKGSVIPEMHSNSDQSVRESKEQGATVEEESIIICDATTETSTNPRKSIYLIKWAAAIFFFLAIIKIIFIKVIKRNIPQATAPISTPATPTVTTPVQNERSPGTPSKEFAEYLYRTLDETPNYKLGARRRFNQQNSY